MTHRKTTPSASGLSGSGHSGSGPSGSGPSPSGGAAGPSRAPGPERVDQLVYRWDAGNRTGNTGFGLVAWSCDAEWRKKLGGFGKELEVAGEATPGLVRVVLQGKVLLAHRTPGHDPGGRAVTVCHVLFGTDTSLPVRTCLGLRRWDWPGSDIALQDVRGELDPVTGSGLVQSARPAADALTLALPQAEDALTAAVAALFRDPGCRHSFLDREGGDVPYLVLRGLHGIFGGMRARPSRGWSFATHDNEDVAPHQFTFVPRWPAGTPHVRERVRTDLERRYYDQAEAVAGDLVRLYLETADGAGGGSGDGSGGGPGGRSGSDRSLPSVLAREAAGIDDFRTADDDLMAAAERTVSHFKSRRARIPHADSPADFRQPPHGRPSRKRSDPPKHATTPRDHGTDPRATVDPRSTADPRGTSGAPDTAGAGNAAYGNAAYGGAAYGNAAYGGVGVGDSDNKGAGLPPGRSSGPAHEPSRPPAASLGRDQQLVSSLRRQVTYGEAMHILKKLEPHLGDWSDELREALCDIAISRRLFLDLPSSPDDDHRVDNAVTTYRLVVRPLAKQRPVAEQLSRLFTELCVGDPADRETVRRVLGEGQLPGLPEDVWREVYLAVRSAHPPAPSAPAPQFVPAPEPDPAPQPDPVPQPAPVPLHDDAPRADECPRDRLHEASRDPSRDRPRGGAHARTDAGRSALTRFAAAFGFGGTDEEPTTRTHLADDGVPSDGPNANNGDPQKLLSVAVVALVVVAIVGTVAGVMALVLKLWGMVAG